MHKEQTVPTRRLIPLPVNNNNNTETNVNNNNTNQTNVNEYLAEISKRNAAKRIAANVNTNEAPIKEEDIKEEENNENKASTTKKKTKRATKPRAKRRKKNNGDSDDDYDSIADSDAEEAEQQPEEDIDREDEEMVEVRICDSTVKLRVVIECQFRALMNRLRPRVAREKDRRWLRGKTTATKTFLKNDCRLPNR